MRPYLDQPGATLYHGDAAEVLGQLAPGSVDAIVTSPPYADLRGYGGASPETYGDWLWPFLVAMHEVTAPTGSLMLNVGRTRRGGVELGIAEDARRRAQAAGWLWIDTLIWNKPNAFYAARAAYLHDTHEYVWWLARSTDAYRGYDADTRTPHSETTLLRFAQGFRTNRSKNGTRYHQAGKALGALNPDGACPKSVVTFAQADHRGIQHPAPMVLRLARHLVSLACPPGGLVLDPFVGSGTTCLAARQRGRRSIGVDRSAAYLDEAARRLGDQLALVEGA